MKLFKREESKVAPQIAMIAQKTLVGIDEYVQGAFLDMEDTWDQRIILYATFIMCAKLEGIGDEELDVIKSKIISCFPFALKREFQQFFINYCNDINTQIKVITRKQPLADINGVIRIGKILALIPQKMLKIDQLNVIIKTAINDIKQCETAL